MVRKRTFGKASWLALATCGLMTLAGPAYAKGKCDVHLKQQDFDRGTYMITAPGTYCLAEDISFNPNSAEFLRQDLGDPSITAYDASFPLPSQLGFGPGQYDPSAFGIGFFAAIAVASPDVVIDLRGHTLEQSEEHALLQRFYANIETADQPFIPGQGPADFGSSIGSAENLVIKNGKIGRSSHHGVHGNRSVNVTIKNIRFTDFEVAAVAINGVQGMHLENLSAQSRRDLPILGQYSTAQFIKAYVNYLVQTGSTTTFNGKSAAQIQAALRTAINNVHHDLITLDLPTIDKSAHPAEWALFHNKEGVVDGNAYGYLVNGDGVAVNGFPVGANVSTPSRDVTMKNVFIRSLKANIREIVGISKGGSSSAPANDPVGSLFQLLAVDPEGNPLALSTLSPASAGSYVGNAVTDAQSLVARATANGEFPFFLDTTRNSISADMVTWAESGQPLSAYLGANPGPHGTGYVCNGDQMFHVNKGVVGFKLDGAENLRLRNVHARNITNIGQPGSVLCGDYNISHAAATLDGYGGAATRAMSISGSTNVAVRKFTASRISSAGGTAIGIDVLTDSSDVSLDKVKVWHVRANDLATSAPTASPEAIGFRIGADTSSIGINRFCSKRLDAYADQEYKIQDLSGSASQGKTCR